MNPLIKQTHLELIEADLQQAWALIDAGQYDLAINHLREAQAKVGDLKDADQPEPEKLPEPVLDI